MISFENFAQLPHAITLLGMSGVGKTVLSTSLRRTSNWYHYSADYRIGTRYLAEDILDNIKYKIMHMGDRFVANLLRSDSIYINHNITVENLDPVSTFLGMYGDSQSDGLGKNLFLKRQDMYRRAEIDSMLDVSRFIDKAWDIYRCTNFINDASGSLCEIVDPSNPDDPVIAALREETLIMYIKPNEIYEEALKKRAHSHPKPLFYNPDFITPKLANEPDDGAGIDPVTFARPLFPELLQFRKPRYEEIAQNYGFVIEADQLFDEADSEDENPVSGRFMEKLYEMISSQVKADSQAEKNFAIYLEACDKRRNVRIKD